jgi:putative endonuclease
MRIAVATKQFQEKSTASSADARGGVAALNQAGSTALAKAIKWGNEAAAASPDCR